MTVPIPSASLKDEPYSCSNTISMVHKEHDFCGEKNIDDRAETEMTDADPLHENDTASDVVQDYVLVIPKRLTKHAQNILFSRRAMPMSWNLEGRFGSRTFRVDDLHMGIPVLDRHLLLEVAARHTDLQELTDNPQVKLEYQPFVEPPKHRTRELPYIGATHHPERAPPDFDLDVAMNEAKSVLDNIPETPLFTYAELFAGMGGFGVALDALGGRCIFASDIEKHLREIYHHNFVTVPNRRRPTSSDPIDIPIHGDIYEIPDSAFPKELDLLVGGFPCQPFSALGEQPGFECQKSGNLFLEIVRVLNISRPKAFLLENVPGLHTMTETYETIVKALEATGYDVTTEVVAARGLTATGRKRLFFVGLRRDTNTVQTPGDIDQTERCKFQFPFIPDLQLKARDVIDYDELPDDEMELLRLSDATFQQLLNCGRWRTHSLAWPNKNLDTLTSHYGNAVGRGESQLVPCKAPNNPRRFSVRECARIMGFPNTYEFMPPYELQTPMGYRKMNFRSVGNAVCPPLIAALAGSVLDCCSGLPPPREGERDWVKHGRLVAIALAKAATRPQPANVPRGCLLPTEY